MEIRPTEFLVSKTTILVVDDETGPRESLRLILSPAHKVLTASNGRDALEILRSKPVDLVTLDLNMPAMKGDELMARIRSEFPSTEIIIITGCGTVRTAVEGLRQGICDYIAKPFDVALVSSAVSRALTLRQSRSRLRGFLDAIGEVLGKDRDACRLIDDLKADSELQNKLTRAIERAGLQRDGQESSVEALEDDSTLEFLDVLAQALESRDSYLRGHAQRVALYAGLLAERIGCDSEERERVRVSSFLHDLGKLGLSQDVGTAQDRSRAEAGEEEHPSLGAKLVEPLGFSDGIASAIRHHHEFWDGGGFPHGLAGEEIPLASRIIAVADAYDAMVSSRPGEPTLEREQALRELHKQGGTRLDPDLVGQFVAIIESGAFDVAGAGVTLAAVGLGADR